MPQWSSLASKTWNVSPGGSRRSSGTPTSITKQPPGSRCAATLRKHATCAACVVRFPIVLKTRYASENVPSTVVVAKSPIVTPIVVAARLRAQPRDHRLRELDPVHRHAARARAAARSGPSRSRARARGRSPASSARKSTAGSTTAGSNISAVGLVVPRRDALVEVAVLAGHGAESTRAERFASFRAEPDLRRYGARPTPGLAQQPHCGRFEPRGKSTALLPGSVC